MSKEILIADDSLTIRKVVELTFLGADCEIVSAATSAEALELLGDDTDLLILDVHLPDGSGYELCEHAKAERPELPVVLLVGTFEHFDEERMKACGADRVLRKPFDSQELASLVDELTGSGAPDAKGEAEMESASMEEEIPAAAEEAAWEGEAIGEAEEPEEPGPEIEAESRLVDAAAVPEGEAESVEPETEAESDEVAGEAEAAEAEASASPVPGGLSDADVERIARRVVELLSDEVVRRVAWEVVPDLAEVVVKERIEELESELSDS